MKNPLPKNGKHNTLSKISAVIAGTFLLVVVAVVVTSYVNYANNYGGPRVIVCPGGDLTLSDDYRSGTCSYGDGGPTLSGADLRRELGEPVSSDTIKCPTALIDDVEPNGTPWAYCE